MKKISFLVALFLVAITGTVSADDSSGNIPFPLTVSSTPVTINPYWISYKIEKSDENIKKLDSDFKLYLPWWDIASECIDKWEWFHLKPGCNKIIVSWRAIGNKTRGEFSLEKIVMDIDLGKEMSRDEVTAYIDNLTKNPKEILGKAYIMKENPDYYETKVLSDDKSVYLLPIKEYSLSGLTVAFGDEWEATYYTDKSENYYRGNWYSLVRIFKNDDYIPEIENIMKKCTNIGCTDKIISIFQETIAGKILSYSFDNSQDEETKNLIKVVNGLFDNFDAQK